MSSNKQQGYGCMGLSAFYSSSKTMTNEKAVDVLLHAYNNGIRLFNSATFYGPLNEEGYGANLRLIKGFLEKVDRSSVQLMVKIGMNTRAPVEKTGQVFNLEADYNGLSSDVDFALQQLNTPYIDIIVLCRVSSTVPIEESVKALHEIVKSGRAKYIGISEASAENIRRAHAVAPIYCIEQEWSLWSRDIEDEIVPTCRELGIKIVAYSPLGRGFLTGSIRSRNDSSLDPNDYRLNAQPKFSEENFDQNLALVDKLKEISERKGKTVGQIALAWIHSQGDDVIPIPGTSTISHLNDNIESLNIELSSDDINQINQIFDPNNVKGDRYAHMQLTFHAQKK